MAHVSAQESQDHMATAFHFLISKRGGGRDFLEGFFLSLVEDDGLESAEGAASAISTSSVFFSVSTMVIMCGECEMEVR